MKEKNYLKALDAYRRNNSEELAKYMQLLKDKEKLRQEDKNNEEEPWQKIKERGKK